MARSVRRTPISGVTTTKSEKVSKRLWARRYRRMATVVKIRPVIHGAMTVKAARTASGIGTQERSM